MNYEELLPIALALIGICEVYFIWSDLNKWYIYLKFMIEEVNNGM